jgi:hypothetical protein
MKMVEHQTEKNIMWFENGMYQGGTERGYDSVNIYDPKTRVIAVFKKQGDGELSLFTTTCQLTALERDHLRESGGNFVTEKNLKNPEVFPILKNLTNNENQK